MVGDMGESVSTYQGENREGVYNTKGILLKSIVDATRLF